MNASTMCRQKGQMSESHMARLHRFAVATAVAVETNCINDHQMICIETQGMNSPSLRKSGNIDESAS